MMGPPREGFDQHFVKHTTRRVSSTFFLHTGTSLLARGIGGGCSGPYRRGFFWLCPCFPFFFVSAFGQSLFGRPLSMRWGGGGRVYKSTAVAAQRSTHGQHSSGGGRGGWLVGGLGLGEWLAGWLAAVACAEMAAGGSNLSTAFMDGWVGGRTGQARQNPCWPCAVDDDGRRGVAREREIVP
jgi:hypothetical protein